MAEPEPQAPAETEEEEAEVFVAACETGETGPLDQLIAAGRFDVNGLTRAGGQRCPYLVAAVEEGSRPVAELLLDRGADVNAEHSRALRSAMCVPGDADALVELLLERGASLCARAPPTGTGAGYGELTAFELAQARLTESGFFFYNRAKYIRILGLCVGHGSRPAPGGGGDASSEARDFRRYFRLCKAIYDDDRALVSELLADDERHAYFEVVGRAYQPDKFAILINRAEIVKAFIAAGLVTREIFFWSVERGDPEALERCAALGWRPADARNDDGQTALHVACARNHLGLVELLLAKYLGSGPAAIEARDHAGRSPLFYARDHQLLGALLRHFPAADINVQDDEGTTLLHNQCRPMSCELHALLLRSGIDLAAPAKRRPTRHICYDYGCPVLRHLQRLCLLDEEYVDRVGPRAMEILFEPAAKFRSIEPEERLEYETELARLRSIRISRPFAGEPARTLYDFVLFGPERAARYSRNEHVLRLYRDCADDFEESFGNYGFALNYQLRRGAIRRGLLEAARALLEEALGAGLPDEILHGIFKFFSDKALRRYAAPAAQDRSIAETGSV